MSRDGSDARFAQAYTYPSRRVRAPSARSWYMHAAVAHAPWLARMSTSELSVTSAPLLARSPPAARRDGRRRGRDAPRGPVRCAPPALRRLSRSQQPHAMPCSSPASL
jgi:hypothetical protein